MKEQTTSKRPRRTSINGVRNILTVKGKEPGYEYRIVNDTGDRLSQFREMGYEVVSDNSIQVGDRRIASPTKEGSPVKVSVGKGESAYLVRIKKDWYDEDQAAKAEHLRETERAIIKEVKKHSDFGSVTIGQE